MQAYPLGAPKYGATTNPLGVIGLVAGIGAAVALTGLFGNGSGAGGVYILGTILALALGYAGRAQIDRSGGTQTGRGAAVAAIVIGWIGVGLFLAILIFFASLINSLSNIE